MGAGRRSNARANNTLMTAAGARPTLVPIGVLLDTGAWYYEVEVVQSSNGGLVSIGWVNSRWQSVHQARPPTANVPHVGSDDGRNDGSKNGVAYFECQADHGIFVRKTQVRPDLGGNIDTSTVRPSASAPTTPSSRRRSRSPNRPSNPSMTPSRASTREP